MLGSDESRGCIYHRVSKLDSAYVMHLALVMQSLWVLFWWCFALALYNRRTTITHDPKANDNVKFYTAINVP